MEQENVEQSTAQEVTIEETVAAPVEQTEEAAEVAETAETTEETQKEVAEGVAAEDETAEVEG